MAMPGGQGKLLADTLKDVQAGAERVKLRALNAANKDPTEEEKAVGAAVKKTTDMLQQQIATYGMSASEIEVWTLKEMHAAEVDLKRAQALDIKLTKMKAVEEQENRAASIAKSVESPLDKFKDAYEEINDLAEKGLLTEEQKTQAIIKQAKELQSAMHLGGPNELASGLNYGSAAAMDQQNLHQMPTVNPLAQALELIKNGEPKPVEKESVDLLRRIAVALENVNQVDF
jgi:hypothetical protein